MPLKTFYKVKNSKGEYSCGDLGISKEEWLSLLKEPAAKPYLNALCCFLREPNHTGTCGVVGLEYDKPASHYNSKITNFSKWVQKKLNRFTVEASDGSDTYWCIAMQKGWDSGFGFFWQLRDELVKALQSYLMEDLIGQYSKKEPFNGFEEEYKWKLLDKTEGKDVFTIINEHTKTTPGERVNLIEQLRQGTLRKLMEEKPNELATCVEHLFDETITLYKRLSTFKQEMQAITPSKLNRYPNDERTAAALLMCKYPEKYTAYMSEVYEIICKYFGFEYNKKAGQKFSHFMKIINEFTHEYGEKIQQLMLPQIDKFKNKPLILAVQTLFWCMKDIMNKSLEKEKKKYWLTGYTFGDQGSQFERFIKDGIWESMHNDGNTSDEKLLDVVKKIAEGDIIILKSTATKGKNHDIPFLRVKAVGIVTSNITTHKISGSTICRCTVKYVSTEEKDFDGGVYGSLRKMIHLADSKVSDIIDYVDYLIEEDSMPQQKYKEYIDLLQETRNLVLTGAPGTGKTFMARAIAQEMGAVTQFVQFHPSYDYTDFVEGLRPVERADGQMGFERRDGVFKEFCHDAIKNLIDSGKSMESWKKELSWKEKLDSFIDDAINNEKKLKTKNGSEFTITDVKGHTIYIKNEQNEKTPQVAVNADDILELLTNEVPLSNVSDIRNYFNRKFGTQANSYAFIITLEVRKMKKASTVIQATKVERKPYVFIIDEINRGEASKVFGELFFAIDPGYRGNQEQLVQTQYQNLVPEDDVFAKGFYVPENVYILATMNDIDRSVESMDFAMRRRFTWKEITPDDTKEMLDTLPCAEEAKATMERLNQAIAEEDGLGAAYMVGPSYFLKLKDNGADFSKLWKMNIEPLLKEYLRGFRKAADILEKFEKAYFNTQS